jgi:hypothetical protein
VFGHGFAMAILSRKFRSETSTDEKTQIGVAEIHYFRLRKLTCREYPLTCLGSGFRFGFPRQVAFGQSIRPCIFSNHPKDHPVRLIHGLDDPTGDWLAY